MPLRKVSVNVPATSANLGPGFDCFGLALDIYATVCLERSSQTVLELEGYGADVLPRNVDNLVHQAIDNLYAQLGKPSPKLHIYCQNSIPINKGLGSSAAAVVGGVVAANALEDNPLTQSQIINLCAQIEGHPDNITPAILGGVQLVVKSGDILITNEIPIHEGLKAVTFIPASSVSTKEARGMLPEFVAREDAVYNIGRAALMVLAFAEGKWELLAEATKDRLHQPTRTKNNPVVEQLFLSAMKAGAVGVYLSGSGPTIMALVEDDGDFVKQALIDTAKSNNLPGEVILVSIGTQGVHITEAE